MSLIPDFQWRHATKQYDTTKKVSEEDLQTILEATRLTPTSSGLEQFRVIVVEDQATKDKIVPIASGQQIVADCSHLLIFVSWSQYTAERIDYMMKFTADERGIPEGPLMDYGERLKGTYLNESAETNFIHTSKQAYIGLGFALAQAANLKIDSTPMEGFSPDDLDVLLGLKEKGYRSVLLMPIGYRGADDWNAPLKKVRVPMEEFVIERI